MHVDIQYVTAHEVTEQENYCLEMSAKHLNIKKRKSLQKCCIYFVNKI